MIKILKKDVNRVLLFLVVVVIFQFAAFTVYYYKNLTSIQSKYEQKENDLRDVTGNAVMQKENETLTAIRSAQQGQKAYEEKLYELSALSGRFRDENEELKSRLENITGQLEEKNLEIFSLGKKSQSTTASNENLIMEKELKRKNDELDVLRQQYDEILVRIIDANFEINEKSMVIGELCQELKNMNKSNDNCPP
ncbi:MAG TPA: hypothetical protein VI564_02765 [Candidatus Nanoarchaeia archaeon]|nr:hypothetical protein [Candidatus Nanoarchaeia archaeon]